jgi:dTDP-4-amino-4,6-dideoxygalactose transaminase
MKVPFNDLNRIHNPLRGEITNAFNEMFEQSIFIGGKWITEFEENLCKYFGLENAVGLSNGTDALSVALRALELPKGSQVLTAANSWISSAEVVNEVGLEVGFVDVDSSGNMSLETLKESITNKTSAVIAVHLRGSMCDIERIAEYCQQRKIALIEDCAQSHMSSYNNRVAGSFGDIATFSFYPGKNLGAFGDAGGLTTKSAELARRARAIANHGALVKHEHFMNGTNARMNPFMAKILSLKMPYLSEWTGERQRLALMYDQSLTDIPQIRFYEKPTGVNHTYHVYSILVDDRDDLAFYLNKNGVETAIHYPTIIPDQKCYEAYRGGPFENSRRYSLENLSLPLFPKMRYDELQHVSNLIHKYYNG